MYSWLPGSRADVALALSSRAPQRELLSKESVRRIRDHVCAAIALQPTASEGVLTEHNGAEEDGVTLSNTAISVIVGEAV